MNEVSTEVKAAEPAQTGVTIIQYPSVVEYDSKPGVGIELAETYGHLKGLDPDSISAYKELKEAIKTVRTLRTDNEKQEKVIKGPLNAFKDLVIDTGKKIRVEIMAVESRLTAEKDRIDGVKADRKAAQEKIWCDNLEIIRAKDKDLFGAPLDAMENHLAIIVSCNIDDFELGDYLEDAKAALANARMRTEQSIAQEKQRLDLAEQQKKLKLEQEEQARKQKLADDAAKEEKRIAQEKADAQQKVIDDLKAEKLEREKKPEPVASAKEAAADINLTLGAILNTPKDDISDIADACGLPSGGANDTSMAVNMKPARDTSDFDDDPAPIELQVSDEDYQKMINYMVMVTAMIENAPVDFVNQECARSMNRVVKSLTGAFNYLDGVSKGGKA